MQKVTATWCEDICKELATINRLAEVRKMSLPIRTIVLKGTKDEVSYVIEQEEALFPGKVVFNDMSLNRNAPRADAIYFYDKTVHNIPVKYLEVDITGICKSNIVKRFINDLQLKNAEIIERLFDLDALTALLEVDYEGVLMKVLMNNMEKSTNGTFSIDDLKDESPLKANIVLSKDSSEKDERDKKDNDSTPSTETSTERVSSQVRASIAGMEIPGRKTPEKEEQKETLNNDENHPEESTPAEEEDIVPKPTIKKETHVGGEMKAELTEEEKQNNEKLLQDLQEEYRRVSTFIKDSKDNRFKAIAKQMDDAVATNVYKTQWCPLYLEVSDDTSSDIYAELYRLDIKTLEFNKKVVRQSVHLGCAFCGNEWDEDVTFKPTGVFFTECPECRTERPFELETGAQSPSSTT